MIEFSDLAEGKLKALDAFLCLTRLYESLGEDGLDCMKFTHGNYDFDPDDL